jgi:hypothetical protein
MVMINMTIILDIGEFLKKHNVSVRGCDSVFRCKKGRVPTQLGLVIRISS